MSPTPICPEPMNQLHQFASKFDSVLPQWARCLSFGSFFVRKRLKELFGYWKLDIYIYIEISDVSWASKCTRKEIRSQKRHYTKNANKGTDWFSKGHFLWSVLFHFCQNIGLWSAWNLSYHVHSKGPGPKKRCNHHCSKPTFFSNSKNHISASKRPFCKS